MAYIDRPRRGIFTFIQATQPAVANPGDTWWDTSSSLGYRYHAGAWGRFSLATDPGQGIGTAGYSCGGLLLSSTVLTSTERLAFTTETISSLASAMTTGIYQGACGESGVAGYVLEGISNPGGPTYTSSLQKMRFSGESWSTITGSLGNGSQHCSVSGLLAMYAADYTGGTQIRRLVFATDAYASISTTCTSARNRSAGAENASAGYFIGSGTTVDRLTFSGEALASITSTFGSIVDYDPFSASSSVAGYAMGNTSGSTTIRKVTFTGESLSTVTSGLTLARPSCSSGYYSRTRGYADGGSYSGSSVTRIDRLQFDTEVVSSLSVGLGTGRLHHPSTQNLG